MRIISTAPFSMLTAAGWRADKRAQLVPKIQGDGNLVSYSHVINFGELRAVGERRYRSRGKLIHRLALLFLFALTASAQNDLPAMKRITGTNTPAHIAARGFMRGANIANCLEVSPGGGSVRHTVTDLQQIRTEGFDHVRLPIAWNHYTGPGPGFKIADNFFARVDKMVTNATALGLNVIIDFHN